MNEYGKKMILAFVDDTNNKTCVTFRMDKTFWQLSNGFTGNYLAHLVAIVFHAMPCHAIPLFLHSPKPKYSI